MATFLVLDTGTAREGRWKRSQYEKIIEVIEHLKCIHALIIIQNRVKYVYFTSASAAIARGDTTSVVCSDRNS